MKFVFICLPIIISTFSCSFQNNIIEKDSNEKNTKLITVQNNDEVEDCFQNIIKFNRKPIFPGCDNIELSKQDICFQSKISEFIIENLIYPEGEKSKFINEKLFVSFNINKKGEVKDVKIELGENEFFKKEALRLINSLPIMKPALVNHKPYIVHKVIPIHFRYK